MPLFRRPSCGGCGSIAETKVLSTGNKVTTNLAGILPDGIGDGMAKVVALDCGIGVAPLCDAIACCPSQGIECLVHEELSKQQ